MPFHSSEDTFTWRIAKPCAIIRVEIRPAEVHIPLEKSLHICARSARVDHPVLFPEYRDHTVSAVMPTARKVRHTRADCVFYILAANLPGIAYLILPVKVGDYQADS